jgi:hypothetical protein
MGSLARTSPACNQLKPEIKYREDAMNHNFFPPPCRADSVHQLMDPGHAGNK